MIALRRGTLLLVAQALLLVAEARHFDSRRPLRGNNNMVSKQDQSCPLPTCQTFHDNQCSGDNINTSSIFEARRWATPSKTQQGYVKSFQDYSHLVAYCAVTYNAGRTSATVEVRALHKDPKATFTYKFGSGESQKDNSKTFSVDDTKGTVDVTVTGSDGSMIQLEPLDFAWNAASLAKRDGDFRSGQKGAIVEFFGWPDKDIEKECNFLAQNGYLGAKVFPHQESVLSTEPFQNVMNPWYFFYQPVSYRLQGRLGSREELRSLITTCRKLGVRLYSDAVINHMTGGGNDVNTQHRNDAGSCVTWGNKSSSLQDLEGGPSPYWTQDFVWACAPSGTNLPPSQEFPAAAYGPLDFHCERPLNSWTDPLDLNAGWLTGLTDLNTEREHVRERIAAYLVDLIGIGFSGFRIDAAKHIRPDDLVAIFTKFRTYVGGKLPDDFIAWLEVLLGGESDLLMCNGDSGYNYGQYLEDALLKAFGGDQDDVNKIKIWNSGYPKETEKGLVNCDQNAPKIRSVIQNDDADQQNPGSSSRDMGDQGCVLIKGCDVSTHRSFEEKLFNSPNGAQDNDNDFPIRMILSSFYWYNNGVQGIPDGKSDCSLCTVNCDSCQTVPYSPAYSASSTGYDGPDGSYTRVHRDHEVISAMQSWMHISTLRDQNE